MSLRGRRAGDVKHHEPRMSATFLFGLIYVEYFLCINYKNTGYQLLLLLLVRSIQGRVLLLIEHWNKPDGENIWHMNWY